jgi:4-amino-4-deoxy-L-arabinose transferase-like glycosyltransferase
MLATALAIGLLLILCIPVFEASRPPINSDQSLYLAESLNIAEGNGPTYPTGEPITHRSPLYPAMLAGVFKLTGTSLDNAYVLPRLTVFINVLLVAALARTLFGNTAALTAGITAAVTPFVRGIGSTLYLDSTLSMFFLASILLLALAQPPKARDGTEGTTSRNWQVHLAAGAMLGAAFLVKETAILFLPIPLALSLACGFDAGWKRAYTGWLAGFVAVTAWWWVWVYAHTGDLFMVGPVSGSLGLLFLGACVIGAAVCAAALRMAPETIRPGRGTWTLFAALMLLWNGVFLYGLDRVAYEYDSDYLGHALTYIQDVVSGNLAPFPLIVIAWCWLTYSAAKRSRGEVLVLMPVLLSLSWTLLVADRLVALRDLLPLIYLSYVALGAGFAAILRWCASSASLQPSVNTKLLVTLAAALALGLWVVWNGSAVRQETRVAVQDDWENPLVHMTADWIEDNIEPSATIMSSRLYYSQIYFETGGNYPIHQLPTVEVALNTSGEGAPLERHSSLFRWEHHLVPEDSAQDRWLYMTYYPKGYYIGLAENDLLTEIQRRDVHYILVTSYDAGFSSPSFNRYFDQNPGFELVQTFSLNRLDEARIYRVNMDEIGPQIKPAMVRKSTAKLIEERLGSQEQMQAYLSRLNPNGFELVDR